MSDSESDSEGEKIRRTKRKVVVKFEFDDSHSSQSDSDASISMARSSRRRRKLSSSENEMEPDQPESTAAMPRRNGTETTAQNSQRFYDDGDESSDSSWCPEIAGPSSRPNARNMPKKIATPSEMEPHKDEQSDTSSDDASSEKCPICLHTFREQEIGRPNICDHSFCAPCIEEWSKNVQTCPIDRKAFSYIIVRDRYENGKIVREIKVVAQSTTLSLDDDDNDMTLCEICNRGDREDRMLLCDDCNLGYHMDCLNPPLADVPTGSWYCDNCFASEQSSDDDDTLHQLIEELETEIGIPETRLRVRRVDDQPRITRTRQSERIRASIISRIAPSRRHAPTNQEESALGMMLPG